MFRVISLVLLLRFILIIVFFLWVLMVDMLCMVCWVILLIVLLCVRCWRMFILVGFSGLLVCCCGCRLGLRKVCLSVMYFSVVFNVFSGLCLLM